MTLIYHEFHTLLGTSVQMFTPYKSQQMRRHTWTATPESHSPIITKVANPPFIHYLAIAQPHTPWAAGVPTKSGSF